MSETRVCSVCGGEVVDAQLTLCPHCNRTLFLVDPAPRPTVPSQTECMRSCRRCGTQVGRADMSACPSCGEPLAPGMTDEAGRPATAPAARNEVAVVAAPWGPIEISSTPVHFGRGTEISPYAHALAAYDNISRRHAVLRSVEEGVLVRDCGSLNGTYVDGHRLMQDEERLVRPGSVIRLGRDHDVELRVVSA